MSIEILAKCPKCGSPPNHFGKLHPKNGVNCLRNQLFAAEKRAHVAETAFILFVEDEHYPCDEHGSRRCYVCDCEKCMNTPRRLLKQWLAEAELGLSAEEGAGDGTTTD